MRFNIGIQRLPKAVRWNDGLAQPLPSFSEIHAGEQCEAKGERYSVADMS